MKILFNCTTNIMGGAVKNAVLFIRHALEQPGAIQWEFAVSQPVRSVLDFWGIDSDSIYVFPESPARSRSARRKLVRCAKDLDVDLVYTMAGPAYVQFDVRHVQGISNPYITHSDGHGYNAGRTWGQMIVRYMKAAYQAYHARKAQFWIFQTEMARRGFCRRYRISLEHTAIVPNAVDMQFASYFDERDVDVSYQKKCIRIFCPAAPFAHKGLQFVPRVAEALNGLLSAEGMHAVFVLTIDEDTHLWRSIDKACGERDVRSCVSTIGSFNYADASRLYETADMVFMPSVLETFSACYLEAFAAGKLLVAADRPFAWSICGTAAVFVEPHDTQGTARAIRDVIVDDEKRRHLIHEGSSMLQRHIAHDERYQLLVDCLMMPEQVDPVAAGPVHTANWDPSLFSSQSV